MLIPFRLTKMSSNNGYRHRSKVLTELFTKYYLVFVAGRGESERAAFSHSNKSKGEKKNIEGIWIELSYSRGEASFKPSFFSCTTTCPKIGSNPNFASRIPWLGFRLEDILKSIQSQIMSCRKVNFFSWPDPPPMTMIKANKEKHYLMVHST